MAEDGRNESFGPPGKEVEQPAGERDLSQERSNSISSLSQFSTGLSVCGHIPDILVETLWIFIQTNSG